ncbi:hypothetical protein NA57DRAFT_71633 [Rhizodiscina lignyota]|uniref:Zn(2)-C6 fungal-type domain-containing protein n=1 Tax=Rhizodiscina lignyota TaxID=1504668 RepID=A0A9P4INU0_9PEZI|nr:hypothetical protein NA57DRAFT_71633 [Rhizodiscina lignyota]
MDAPDATDRNHNEAVQPFSALKRPSCLVSPPDSTRTKRPRFNPRSLDDFSKAERTILQGAAEILDIPVGHLLAAATSLSSSGSTITSPDSRDIGSPPSNDIPRVDGIPYESTAGHFSLALPKSSHLVQRRLESSGTSLAVANNGDWMQDQSFSWDETFAPPPAALFNDIDMDYQSPILMAEVNDVPNSMVEPSFPCTQSTDVVVQTAPEPLYFRSDRVQLDLGAFSGVPTATLLPASNSEHPSPHSRTETRDRQVATPPECAEERHKPNDIRDVGACIRCREQHIQCESDPSSPNGCCLTCAKLRTRRLPCLRYKVSDALLFDHADRPRPSWSQRWKNMKIVDIREWASDEVKTITITQDVGSSYYNLRVRKFVPVQGDSLCRRWKHNNEERSFQCTPYAIANMREAGHSLLQFAEKTLCESICFYIDETDKLLRDTYAMAYRHSRWAKQENERQLLRAVLRLWCACRMESRSERICGIEALGMQPQYFEDRDPNDGHILVPPVFSAQMEVIVTAMILQPAQKQVLRLLNKVFEESKKQRSWFSIYLALFILLHSCALLTEGDNKKAKKQGSAARYFRNSLIEELHYGTKILLHIFTTS